MTTQSRISRQDKTRQFSQLWLLWRFWSSKSIKSQIEGRIFNFSPLTLIIVQWAVWTSLCGVSDAWVGGWWFYFATRFPLRLQILICSNCQEILHCKWPQIARKSLQNTFAGVICKIWDLFALNHFLWVMEETFLHREFSIFQKINKGFWVYFGGSTGFGFVLLGPGPG